MPEIYTSPGVIIPFLGALIGVFIAREFNLPYYLVIGLGVLLSVLGNPFLHLAGGVAMAIGISRILEGYVQEVS